MHGTKAGLFTLEQDELNLLASISNTLANYINKVMSETISKNVVFKKFKNTII